MSDIHSEIKKETFWVLRLLKKCSLLTLSDSEFTLPVNKEGKEGSPDSYTQFRILDLLESQGLIKRTYQHSYSAISTLSKSFHDTPGYYTYELIQPQFDQFFKKYEDDMKDDDIKILGKEDQAIPSHRLFVHGDNLYYKGKRVPKSSSTITFIFIKAVYELAPGGGEIKKEKIIAKMNKLNVSSVGKNRVADQMMVKNLINKLNKEYKLDDGASMFQTLRGKGLLFHNPPLRK